MKEIKKFFTETLSSVWYMGFAFLFGLIAMLMMFAPAFYNTCVGFRPYAATEVFFDAAGGLVKGAWPAFLGYMLVTLGFVATGIIALPIIRPSAKLEKVILIGSVICEFAGLILVSLILVEYNGFNNVASEIAAKSYLKGGTISFIVFDILTMCSTAMAALLDW